jgi:16S rRNA (uracil1498-N3)-methyltransferase
VDKNQNITAKIFRWKKISQEAAQISRGIIPEVKKLHSFEEILKIFSDFDLVILPWEEEKNNYLKEVILRILRTSELKKILLIIGPEGGFTKEETETANENGAHVVTLGPRIMKAEVAAVSALSSLLGYF